MRNDFCKNGCFCISLRKYESDDDDVIFAGTKQTGLITSGEYVLLASL